MSVFEDAFREYAYIIAHGVVRAFVIYVIVQGIVYWFGRMLEIVNSNRGRNAVALLSVILLSYWSVLIYDMELISNPMEVYWRTIAYAAGASILFVLIGWKLFSRVDALLDKKIGPDQKPGKKK